LIKKIIRNILIKIIKIIFRKEILFYENTKKIIKKKKNKKIVIEVGANKGTDTQKFLEEGYTVYCFEPTPELIVILQNKFSVYKKQFFLIPLAVDTQNSFREFNLAKHDDWGVSSFYKFSDNIVNKKEWSERNDFYFDQSINVMTIRLDTFLDLYNIKSQISYLWIDTQGNDFRVLQSLGNKINKVKKGKCEASMKTKLYKGAKNDFKTIQKFLIRNNFKTKIIADSKSENECDIHFEKNV